MTKEYDEFQTAYLAWKKATERYEEYMDELWKGAPIDALKVDSLVDEMAKTHTAFMGSSKPFVR